MSIRVILIGTGGVGGHALRSLIANPQYELVGVWVSSDAKAGRDAGDLAGLDISTGIKATTDLDALLAMRPDCAVYAAIADTRMLEALEDYRRIVAAGVNVVGTGEPSCCTRGAWCPRSCTYRWKRRLAPPG